MKNPYTTLPPSLSVRLVSSPVGDLVLIASSNALQILTWMSGFSIDKWARLPRPTAHPVLDLAEHELREYFLGHRSEFTVAIEPLGTEFQIRAWNELRKIPVANTISYSEQASRLGDRHKARAVGSANSRNPIAVVIPCHRVIASGGKLSGFAGGVHNKQWLLQHEQRVWGHS